MALTPDQNATLQLLLVRGQSYADIAAVLGGSEDDVRARARAALQALGGADPDRNVGLTDYLLGQADPIGRADAVRHLRDHEADHRLAAELLSALRERFPEASLPRLPGEPRPAGPRFGRRRSAGREGAGGEPSAAAARGGRGAISSRQARIIVAAAASAVLVVAIVLAVTGAFGGGDDSPAAAEGGPGELADGREVAEVPLRPVGGGDARGEAVFALAGDDQPFVELDLRGLDPAPRGRTYVAWLMLDERRGYPLSPLAVGNDGTYRDRFPIPSLILPAIIRVRFVHISIAPTNEIEQLVRRAIRSGDLFLEEPGDVVLRGEIPTSPTRRNQS